MMGNYYVAVQGDTGTARRYYDRAVALDPGNHLVINNMGGMLLKAGQPDEAERYLSLALEQNAEYANTHYGLAMIYHRRGDLLQAFERAVDALRFADQRDPVYKPAAKLTFDVVAEYERAFDARAVAESYAERLEEASGKPVEIKASPGIDTPAKLEVAETHGRDKHVVLFKPDALHSAHLVMHELVHWS